MMKKALMIGIVLCIILLTIGPASAWHRHSHFHFGVIIPPFAFWTPPSVYYREYYPPYRYYPPDDYGQRYYRQGYRVWVPGYWEKRWTPYGWERVWIPGYWEYRR